MKRLNNSIGVSDARLGMLLKILTSSTKKTTLHSISLRRTRGLFRNANPSNLRGSLLEGNKDHLLIQARSDLTKQELHVRIPQYVHAVQDAQYGLNLDENWFDCKKICRGEKKFSEILRCRSAEKITRPFSSSRPNRSKCQNR